MNRNKILVADSSETSRKAACDLLNKQGYWTFQASDGPHTLRIARSLNPELVIIDTGLWGTPAGKVGKIIESDGLSTVLYITAQVTPEFLDLVKQHQVYAYLTKPLQPRQVTQILDFALVNSRRIIALEHRIQQLERTLEDRKMIEHAKGLLMLERNLGEPEAYHLMRKMAMESRRSLGQVARSILRQ